MIVHSLYTNGTQTFRSLSKRTLTLTKLRNNYLNPTSNGECKLLGSPWDKLNDNLQVIFPAIPEKVTRREVLAHLARIYDPLCVVSPVTLLGKQIYRETCLMKLAWDAPLPEEIAVKSEYL